MAPRNFKSSANTQDTQADDVRWLQPNLGWKATETPPRVSVQLGGLIAFEDRLSMGSGQCGGQRLQVGPHWDPKWLNGSKWGKPNYKNHPNFDQKWMA